MDANLRELAPLSDRAWEAVEEEARQALKSFLAARKLVDFTGPLGREAAAVSTGRVRELESNGEGGVERRVRLSQPLVELGRRFRLSRRELEDLDRGAADADLDPVVEAARDLALAEDRLVFHGSEEASVTGLIEGSEHEELDLGSDYVEYPKVLVEGLHRLEEAGVPGPYALALGPSCYAGVMKTIHPGGKPVISYVRGILENGPVVRAHAIQGGVLLSLTDGAFELVCGEDIVVRCVGHTADEVELALEETLTFRLLDPRAVIALRSDT